MGAQAVSLDQQTSGMGDFWAYIQTLTPLAGLCAILGALYHLSDACKERNWVQRFTVIVVAGAGGAVAGPIATMFAHELLPTWSHLAHMAIGCAIGSMGPQAALVLARKVRKMTTLDLGDPGDIGDCKQLMTPEERARHADTCPFESDRYEGWCMQCPHRKERND